MPNVHPEAGPRVLANTPEAALNLLIVRHNVERLRHAAPILADLVDKDELRVVGGVYDLATGKVELV
jgi:carbonic anhydrase